MPFRRMGRPGLVGLAARTAVVAGTATAVSGGMRNRQADKQQQEYEAQQYEAQQQQAQMNAAAQQAVAQQQALAQQQAQQAAAAAPAASVDIVAELQKLGALKEQGILTDDEFAAAKAKLLG